MKNTYYSYRRLNTHQAMEQASTQAAAPVLPSLLNCYLPAQTESGVRLTLRRLLRKWPRLASH